MKTRPQSNNPLGKRLLKICNHRFWLATALFTLALLCTVGPLRIFFNRNFLIQQLDQAVCCQVVLFILTYIVITVIGIPGTILTIAGGFVFGLVEGTLWSVVGATLGAMGAFWAARYLLHDWIGRRFGKHKAIGRFKQAVTEKPFAFVLAIRFVPITPFNAINFLFGLTPVHWVPYSLATLIGIIPGTFAYTWIGVSGLEALHGGDRLPFFLALALLALLSILPFCRKP